VHKKYVRRNKWIVLVLVIVYCITQGIYITIDEVNRQESALIAVETWKEELADYVEFCREYDYDAEDATVDDFARFLDEPWYNDDIESIQLMLENEYADLDVFWEDEFYCSYYNGERYSLTHLFILTFFITLLFCSIILCVY
jgi:hypothetical protein